ncbi:uncharacterized protein LOC105835836 [Monomorium pharaonis]|uniref:uncharacterized protein LOC105835836 n=1 Tax=Monomorium pharaonis TaxID=307658 RepID=UPI00174776F3|nr:uncharacterized protein LOC105835836 [Monomorium pharaonis]XP_036141614.1 uncharacterized protein LOC105835836 [Monomorium pharaonis]
MISINDTCKIKNIALSSKTVKPDYKSSLPSLIKNVRMQSDFHVTAILKTLVDRQEETNGKIDNVILMLNRIYRKLVPEEEKVRRPKNLPTLPLSDKDVFSEMQTFLISEDNFYPIVDYIVKLMKADGQTDYYQN